ncbi:Tat pathway signal sequence domain protein [Streptomyces sp. NPDC014870]|uniref:Tat pathway signal sequence domain protein n=1 Tax=Streptomyces sp. NPDC014870 TaxID=3364925 RepID=UPI0036FE97F1
MSGAGGVGPIEAGDGTSERPPPAPGPRRTRFGPGPLTPRARLLLACALGASAACAITVYVTTRPAPAPPPEALPPAPPSQRIALRYGEPVAASDPGAAFAFTVLMLTSSGPPVTVESIGQPSSALSLRVRPALPVSAPAGQVREVVAEIDVVDCVHVARNSGLPFLEVTLSNAGQKEAHSYILGDRYAADLSTALNRACPMDRDQGRSTPS